MITITFFKLGTPSNSSENTSPIEISDEFMREKLFHSKLLRIMPYALGKVPAISYEKLKFSRAMERLEKFLAISKETLILSLNSAIFFLDLLVLFSFILKFHSFI